MQDTTDAVDTFLDSAEVARRLSVSVRTVKRWCDDGRLPRPVILAGSTRRWPESAIKNWIDNQPCQS